jgi:hypothetical protein
MGTGQRELSVKAEEDRRQEKEGKRRHSIIYVYSLL